MAPEMVARRGYGKAVDFWSTGVLGFEMMTGQLPFRDKDVKKLHRKILGEKVKYPQHISGPAVQLLKRLLERNVSKRLGAAKTTMFEVGGIAALKDHAFFTCERAFSWKKIEEKTTPPPLHVGVAEVGDTSNFDKDITALAISGSITGKSDSICPEASPFAQNFRGFSYVSPAFRRTRSRSRAASVGSDADADADGVDGARSRSSSGGCGRPLRANSIASLAEAPDFESEENLACPDDWEDEKNSLS